MGKKMSRVNEESPKRFSPVNSSGENDRRYLEKGAWIILSLLILFHLVNNYLIVKMDTIPFVNVEERAVNYIQASQTVESLQGKNLFWILKTIYFNNYWDIPVYPPLWAIVSEVIMLLFGTNSDTALMTGSIFLPVLLISTFLLGKELFDVVTGLIAAILVSFFPTILAFSRAYRPDYALTAMVALSTHLMLQSKGMGLRKRSAIVGIVLGLSALCKESLGIFIIGPLLVLLIPAFLSHLQRPARSERLRRILTNVVIAGILALIIAGPWYFVHGLAYLNIQREQNRLSVFAGRAWNLSIGLLSSIWALGGILHRGFLLISLIAAIYLLFCHRRHRLFLLTWIAIPILFFISIGLEYATIQPLIRYLLPIAPAGALVVALFLNEGTGFLIGNLPLKWRATLIVIGLLIIEIILFSAMTYGFGSGDPTDPFGRHLNEGQRILGQKNRGILSPAKSSFDIEKIADLIFMQTNAENRTPSIFLFNPKGPFTQSLVMEVYLRQSHGELGFVPSRMDCHHNWSQEGAHVGSSCMDELDLSDYAVIESIDPESYTFPHEEERYKETICPLMAHIRDSLGEYTIISQLNLHPRRHSCFDWLNGSVWLLRRVDRGG